MEPGGPRWITARTSGRSMPMPKALVATTTSTPPLGEPALGELARAAVEPGVIGGGAPAGAGQPRRSPPRPSCGSARRRSRCRRRGPGPPRASASAASTSRSRSRRPSTSTARRARFGRAKPRTIWGVSGGQAEPREDLVADDRGRGGRAGEHARGREVGDQRADPEILRAEVVAPLADAVGLVHRDQRDADLVEHGPEAGERRAARARRRRAGRRRRPAAPCAAASRPASSVAAR